MGISGLEPLSAGHYFGFYFILFCFLALTDDNSQEMVKILQFLLPPYSRRFLVWWRIFVLFVLFFNLCLIIIICLK